jgi:hypothetical protein
MQKKGPCGFIDVPGKMVIPPAYAYVRDFSEGLAAVTPIGESFEHFINTEGARAFAGDYLGAHDFRNGLCRVSTLETTAYIGHEGQTVWEGPYVDRP